MMSCGLAMGLFPWRGCGEISSHQSGATGCSVQAQGCLGETVTAGRPSSHLSALQLPLSSGQRGWVALWGQHWLPVLTHKFQVELVLCSISCDPGGSRHPHG